MIARRRCYHDAVLRIVERLVSILDQTYPDRPRLVLANRNAGTPRRHREICRAVERYIGSDAYRLDGVPFVWTVSPEHAVQVLDRSAHGDSRIVVSIGGDGTHNVVLSAALARDRRDLVFVRVPAGSGNDSTTVGRIDDYLARLDHGLVERTIPAVLVETQQRRFYSFNIAGMGIDAYVTALHDRWRSRLPGDTYRLMADLAVLRYEKNVSLGPSRLTGVRGNGETIDLGSAVRNLIVFGVDGHRTYGDHMRVLPGDENVCIIGTAGLREKIRMKKLFFAGAHTDQPTTTMAALDSLSVEYAGRLPLQVDGEAFWIEAEEFPVRFSRIQRSVSVIDLSP